MNRLKRAKGARHTPNQAGTEARELEMGVSTSQADLWAEGREGSAKAFRTLQNPSGICRHREIKAMWTATP